MGKLSIRKTAANAVKKSANAAGKLAKAGAKQVYSAGKKVMAVEMPSSLNWIFGFGFKVGIFLILKSFLILRYEFSNLHALGFVVIGAQSLQALILIACGALMQNKSLYDEPLKLQKIAGYYGYALIIGLVVFAMKGTFDWAFFKEPKAVNWFVDFFNSISKGASEIGLSLLFWDCDLWGAFCGLLYFITNTYLHVSFDYEEGIWARIFDKVHFLREAQYTTELVEEASNEEI